MFNCFDLRATLIGCGKSWCQSSTFDIAYNSYIRSCCPQMAFFARNWSERPEKNRKEVFAGIQRCAASFMISLVSSCELSCFLAQGQIWWVRQPWHARLLIFSLWFFIGYKSPCDQCTPDEHTHTHTYSIRSCAQVKCTRAHACIHVSQYIRPYFCGSAWLCLPKLHICVFACT